MKKWLHEWAYWEKKFLKISLPFMTLGLIMIIVGDRFWTPLVVVGIFLIILAGLLLT